MGTRPTTATSRFLMPREHGAWGLFSLPFLAGAVVARGLGQRADAGGAVPVVLTAGGVPSNTVTVAIQ